MSSIHYDDQIGIIQNKVTGTNTVMEYPYRHMIYEYYTYSLPNNLIRNVKNIGVNRPNEYIRHAAVGTNPKKKSFSPAINLLKLPAAATTNTKVVKIQNGPYISGFLSIFDKNVPFNGINACFNLFNTIL